MLKYLNSTSASAGSITDLIKNLTTLQNAVTIANATISSNSVNGALVVTGGVGVGENINLAGNLVANGNITGLNGRFTNNLTVIGTTTSSYLRVSGSMTASSGVIGILNSTTLNNTGSGTFGSLQVNSTANVGIITAQSGTIGTLTATSISGLNTLTSAITYTTDLHVDNILPRSGTQVNLGSVDAVRITGGNPNQVLGTDGNGNLSWIQGPAALTFGTGLTRNGDTVSLAGTGFPAGVYNRVTIDEFGRVIEGASVTETLEQVTGRGATTSRIITITNNTDATDVTEGALVVDGGVGIGGTLVATNIVSKADTTVEGTLTTSGSLLATRTATFSGATAGEVPIKISSGGLIPGAAQGSLEFDGDYLYITTNAGRQVLSARDANVPAVSSTIVRAVATRNINVSSPDLADTINGNDINNFDEVVLVPYDKILLANQDDAAENGIWVWQAQGVPLTRTPEFNASTGIFSGLAITVSEGVNHSGSMWSVETPNPISVGSTDISIVEHLNKNSIAFAQLPQDTTSGLVVRTEYGAVALRQFTSSSTWITVTNPTGKAGDITIGTGTVPVSSGGTGRTSITGWMRGTGSSILSTSTIPVSDIAGAGTMSRQDANNVSIIGGNISVANTTTQTLTATTATITGNTVTNNLTANVLTVASLNVAGAITVPGLLGNTIQLGANTTGALRTAAVSVSTTQNVTDTIALMNVVLGKLVPPSPPNFPANQTLSISSLTLARMANFTQTDNTATGGRSVAAGTTVTGIRRSAAYSTSTTTTAGPGDTGAMTVYVNGQNRGTKNMVGAENSTTGDLVISNNQDYHNIVPAVNSNFWYSFDARAAGTVSAGWNEVYLEHSAGAATNKATWYYDSSTPGTPAFTNATITMDVNVAVYSSTIPHYTSDSRFDISFDINRLSGDTYPTSDTFVVGSAGGAFVTPINLTYSDAGISTPLSQNLYVSGGSKNITTKSNIIAGFGSSAIGPTLSVSNGYATGTNTFNPTATILYKTGTSTQIEETSIPVNSVGSGSGNAVRIANPGSSDTPAYTASAVAFNSQTGTLRTYDATVVAAVLKHDQTNYSTGYLPIGPNLSTGRSGAQYFTFKFVRSVVSKFDVKYSGTIAGIWVALPGSSTDTTSTLNGWLSLSNAYNGAGVPGAGAGGNGSNGCAVGGVALLNSAQSNKRITATFGTVSSSSTATREIYVRIKLTSGQTVTALSIEAASN